MGDDGQLIFANEVRSTYPGLPVAADRDHVTATWKLATKYLWDKQRTGQITAGTATDQRHTLRGFAELAPKVTQVNRRAVLRWFDGQRQVAPATRRTRYSTVRCFTRWLQRKGHIRHDPTADVPAPKVPRPAVRTFTPEQATALVAACTDLTDLLIVSLGYDMGLRRAEAAALEVGDLTFGAHPTMTVEGKGQHRRILPIPTSTMAILDRYVEVNGITAGPLLRLRRYPERGVKPVWVGRRLSELAYAAGIKARPRDGMSHHALRRSLATKLWVATGDAVLVADVLGHVDLSQLRRYVRSMDVERMRKALDDS